ncbi:MAG: dTDP-glucose 4,6-dehydratase, partial [Flavobacteriales bacterium]
MNILITGGAGFIGSHTLRHFLNKYSSYKIVNLDKLTYAGNLNNLVDIADLPNYIFIKGDINDSTLLDEVFKSHQIDSVIHLAAESHVDRSISGPDAFLHTNVMGTLCLLNACRKHWQDFSSKKFYHVSTDEVFGSLGALGHFNEDTAYDPRSPYSASKASSDHLVRAYYHTYGLPVVISNCSNNFGSHHFPEKLIPLIINNIRQHKSLPVYGKGENVRDWLWVEDHARAIDVIFHNGKMGDTYCIGGNNEWKNIDLVRLICRLMDGKLSRHPGTNEALIQFVT